MIIFTEIGRFGNLEVMNALYLKGENNETWIPWLQWSVVNALYLKGENNHNVK